MSTGAAGTAAIPHSETAAPAPPATMPVKVPARGLIVVGTLLVLADWLLYDHKLGIGLVVFVLAVAAGTLASNPLRADRGTILLATCVLIAGQLPHAVNPSVLSFAFSVASVVAFAALLFANPGTRVWDRLGAARQLALSCFRRAPMDLRHTLVSAAAARPKSMAATLVVWFMPVTLGLIFASLFADANPLLASWISAIDIKALLRLIADHLDASRIAFWLMMLLLVWPVIFVREYQRRAPRAPKESPIDAPTLAIVGKAAVLRSLIVFNVLFAVQTALDALYLWGGVSLPDGMSYAEYAHRGAYPLIVTALLAAGFVVVALRPGSDTERSPVIRGLVYLWIAQNVWLVVSSILRLDIYVAAYSLTYWRAAALVWMTIVGMGLVLIFGRIGLRRSNTWLIGANLISVALTLYLCAFANFANIIANYNVAHSFEMGGGGPSLDRNYLRGLGGHAIPAADAFLARNPDIVTNSFSYESSLSLWRKEEEQALQNQMQDWRGWNYWDWKLARYLAP